MRARDEFAGLRVMKPVKIQRLGQFGTRPSANPNDRRPSLPQADSHFSSTMEPKRWMSGLSSTRDAPCIHDFWCVVDSVGQVDGKARHPIRQNTYFTMMGVLFNIRKISAGFPCYPRGSTLAIGRQVDNTLVLERHIMRTLFSPRWKIILIRALIVFVMILLLGGSFLGGVYLAARKNMDLFLFDHREELPPVSWFEAVPESEDGYGIGMHTWHNAPLSILLPRLAAMEKQIRSKPPAQGEENPRSWLFMHWHYALAELALHRGFEIESRQRFQAIVAHDPAAFDHGVFARLAWQEIERRIPPEHDASAVVTPRDADSLWAAVTARANALESESSAEIARWNKLPPEEREWKHPPKETSYVESSEKFAQLAAQLLDPCVAHRVDDIEKWTWGSWCGTGAEGFGSTRNLALLLVALNSRDIPKLRACLLPVSNSLAPSFDTDPRSQEIRLRRIINRMERLAEADFTVDCLASVLATRRTGVWYYSSQNELFTRLAGRGGDAIARALLRILDVPGAGRTQAEIDDAICEVLPIFIQGENQNQDVLSMCYEDNSSSFMGGRLSFKIQFINGTSTSGSSTITILEQVGPENEVSPPVRDLIRARLKAHAKAKPSE